MSISKKQFEQLVKGFKFRELFNELGWDNDKTAVPPVSEDKEVFNLKAVAHKSGFKIIICPPQDDGLIPDYSMRKKIESKITKLFQEHLIIYTDSANKEQIWQLTIRHTGKPSKTVETRYKIDQSPELLYQKASGLFFSLDEEEKITIVDVTARVSENFSQNSEKVTKKFYEGFKREHTAFIDFIKGIEDKFNLDWYASLMLNRLMFCYFIQKKGFLDNNRNYLKEKLKLCKSKNGENQFYSFYRNFLLVLFHSGLGAPEHSKDIEIEIGKIPYLNGGLFDEHEIEKTYKNIDISDNAFEQIFDFFDQYEWHLDTRANASGKEVNPDVIGFIFEKYINDRAQMGAYYTKEDITEYIGKNCIIPFLFDETKRRCPESFEKNAEFFKTIKESGNNYIYPSVKYGIPENEDIFSDLPEEIKKGFNPELEQKIVDGSGIYLSDLRISWNKVAPETIALPTEIYREVIERRKRYKEIKNKIDLGEIAGINDFITYNLNIRQFSQDVIENTNDPKFLKAFYNAISSTTILDPTCGSGAFLFAALNILEPLYEACISRMRAFVEDEDRANKDEKPAFYNKHKYFREILQKVQSPEHPNLQYFIYKSIILNNLYGVDIMKEAVEIAKLRLFLKLVATVEPNYQKPNFGLEPLPDIDFNIRSGNTLIGFANNNELDDALLKTIEGPNILRPIIDEKMEVVSMAFKRYKEIQLKGCAEYKEFKEAKDDLFKRLNELNQTLHKFLHRKDYMNIEQDNWVDTHKPFHWLAEFYEIIHDKGGFDVIIGNPPYVEYSKVKKDYELKNFLTLDCNNLWAYVLERVFLLSPNKSYISMIVPMSLTSSSRMLPIQKMIIEKGRLWVSNYESGSNPGQLFVGVKQNLSIFILNIGKIKTYHTTKFTRFFKEARNNVFEVICYANINSKSFLNFGIHKIGNTIQYRLLCSLFKNKPLIMEMVASSENKIFVHRIASYYIKCFDFTPYFSSERDGEKKSEDYKEYCFEYDKNIYLAAISSSLFYIYWQVYFDNFKAGKHCIESFPFSSLKTAKDKTKRLKELSVLMMDNMLKNSIRIVAKYKSTGKVEYDNFFPRLSKPIIDEIDKVLAEHYGFTHDELDFIINYDIKYRMGKELDDGEE